MMNNIFRVLNQDRHLGSVFEIVRCLYLFLPMKVTNSKPHRLLLGWDELASSVLNIAVSILLKRILLERIVDRV